MRKYESTITFRFKEENWSKAQKANQEILRRLIELFSESNVEVQCKRLTEQEIW